MDNTKTLYDFNIEILQPYPHCVKKLETFWGRLEFLDYIDSLIYLEDRITRQGFPIKVMLELLNIKDYYINNLLVLCVHNGLTAQEKLTITQQQIRRSDPYAGVKSFGE